MRNLVLAAIGSAALGLFAAAPASATPLATSTVLGSQDLSPLVQDVRWRNVCKTRTVWRHGARRTIRDCDRVWVGPPRPYAGSYKGKRYYRNGYYYRDPGFRVRIY